MNRAKLDMVIEREVHKFVRDIREHAYDFTHLFIRRNGIEVDHAQVEKILEIVKLAIDDGELSKINMFHERIKGILDEVSGEENPFQPTVPVQEPQSPQQNPSQPRKVSFSL